jgi:2-oxo-4-hydroxy-4-carboxy-5-ureidoimidazoline decarboxylase
LSDGLRSFNALAGDEAERRLRGCFANQEWAARVAGGRPYEDLKPLLAAAETAFEELNAANWLAAIASHPRIGERAGRVPASSEREQRLALQAPDETLAALADENRRYEARFGHVFLIAASGRGAEEILGELRRRMANDPAAELDEVSRELRQITRMRLERMLES